MTIYDIHQAFEVLRRKMRGDTKGEELAAFAGVDQAIRDTLRASAPAARQPACKTIYVKALRTLVAVDERYADRIRDLLNTSDAPSVMAVAEWRAFYNSSSPKLWGIETTDTAAVEAGLEIVVAPCMPEHVAKELVAAYNAVPPVCSAAATAESAALQTALEQVVLRANQPSAGETELLTKIADMHRVARYALLPLAPSRTTASTDEPATLRPEVKEALESAHSLIVYFGNAHGSMESEHGRLVHREVSSALLKIDNVLDAALAPSAAMTAAARSDDSANQRRDQLEGLGIGLEQRGEKSAAHLIKLILADLATPPSSGNADAVRERIYEAALKRIAASRMHDFGTLHPEGCAAEAKEALHRAALSSATTPSAAICAVSPPSPDTVREKDRADLAEKHLNQIYDYLGCCRSGSAVICTIKEREAALSSAPVAGAKQWHHKKSGHVVTEIGRGRVQASTPIVEMQDVVIYEHDGNMWVRAVAEFEDGRFEPVSQPRNDRGGQS